LHARSNARGEQQRDFFIGFFGSDLSMGYAARRFFELGVNRWKM